MKATSGPFRPRPSRLTLLRACRFPSAYGDNPLKLAASMNSLARAPRRTMEPWNIPLSYTRVAAVSFKEAYLMSPIAFNRLVSSSLHPPSGVLFSVPSQYCFAIGLGLYLALEIAPSHLPTAIPNRGTLEATAPTCPSPTGPSPSVVGPSRPLRLKQAGR